MYIGQAPPLVEGPPLVFVYLSKITLLLEARNKML